MFHAWITHWAVARASLTMPRLHYTWSHLLYATEPYMMDEARATNTRMVKMRTNPFLHMHEPIWRLECPFLNHDVRDKRANRRTEHGERPTYQIKHF